MYMPAYMVKHPHAINGESVEVNMIWLEIKTFLKSKCGRKHMPGKWVLNIFQVEGASGCIWQQDCNTQIAHTEELGLWVNAEAGSKSK